VPIALTMGDPAGIGPELCCRLAGEHDDVVVIGSRALLAHVARRTGLAAPEWVDEPSGLSLDATSVLPGQPGPATGAAAATAIEAAVAGCLDGRYGAMVTAPISKAAVQAAGVSFPGHTEWIAARCGVARPVMMLHDERLAVGLVTVHRSLASVPAHLDRPGIVHTGSLLAAALRQLNGREPRLAVLGLNPHGGEEGLFGAEEQEIVAPAVAELRAEGIDAEGPLPPDTAFTAVALQRFDGHVCLYHDQGLIPFKALAFAEGVNVTLGLPIVRTSPDHGTAFDIAWRGLADAGSLRAAIALARRLRPDNPGFAR
jgi:4-hydroxythreonine-4-phosphate dehydrogenase